MSPSQFVATRLTPTTAMDLWCRADGASAFTRPDYLERLVDEAQWWGVERSGEVVAAWPVARTADGDVGPPPFCYYVGPLFARSLREGKPYCRYWSGYTDAFSTLVDVIVAEHPRFRFSLAPGVIDARVLEWWNFDHPEQTGFRITPRYTARIDLSAFIDDAAMRRTFASTRRRDIDRWAATPPTVVDDVDSETIVELHDEALKRSGAPVDSARHEALRRSIALIQSGAGANIGFVPPGQTRIGAVISLLDGADESNSVFYSAGDDWREQGLTAWAVWHGLLRARSLGLRWFDFNGANSPRRAADKHFYSAETALYFDCSFEQ